MSFDKYLFEKYTKDCAVEIFLPDFLNKGTGFWVLPDGHILTCYHILIPKKKDVWGNEVEIENIDIENINIQIRYHGKGYTAVLDKQHSKKDLDIAVLTVKEIDEIIHFVPLGESDLNTEVHAFGYRVGFNGYHISGIVRQGQELPDAGLVYNLETHQPNGGSVDGMSGAPVYDINRKKVVGLQYGQERVGPSICYVHPIAKVYKLWPELRIKNFNSIRKDFNIYFMSSDLPKSIFALGMALLQYQLENKLGKEAIGVAEQTFFYVGNEKVAGKLYKILDTPIGAHKFMNTILRASKHFYNNCKNENLCDAFTMPAHDLLLIQAVLNDLPKILDREDALKAISENLGHDYPELTETQLETGLGLYSECLEKELSPLKDFVLSIIAQGNKQNIQREEKYENTLRDFVITLEEHVVQRGIYMVLDDLYVGLGLSIAEEEGKEILTQIPVLEKILHTEAAALRTWHPQEHRAYLLQQIHNRALEDEGTQLLRTTCKNLLTERNEPWLAERYPSGDISSKSIIASERHILAVLGLAFSIDGKYLVSASRDHTSRLWDIETGQSVRTSKEHTNDVYGVAVSPDGKEFLSVSADHTMCFRDFSNALFNTISLGKYNVFSAAFTPNGENVALGFSDNKLRLWNKKNNQPVKDWYYYAGHDAVTSKIVFMPDSKHFISASDDTTLRLWNINSHTAVRIFSGHLGSVYSVALTPNGRQIISASADHTLRLWDLSKDQPLHIFEGHTAPVHGVAVTPNGKYAISASADNTIRLWDISTRKCLSLLTGDEAFKCCTISPKGSLIAAGDQAGEIHLFEIRNIHTL